jgi:hypothetical protein
MEIKVHEWLNESDQSRWVCIHVMEFLAHLKQVGGNLAKNVGLVNYRSPSAVVFVEKPIQEHDTLEFVRSHPPLKPIFNGINRLSGIRCEEHFVDVEQWNETQA